MKTATPVAAVAEGRSGWFSKQRRTLRRLRSYPRALAVARKTAVGTTPCEVVHQSGTHRLLRYRRETPARWSEPVLWCYALINRPYILDLQPDKSIVRKYLDEGFDVYLIDWGVPSHEERSFTLDHYVSGFLHKCIEIIRAETGSSSVHLQGYCMGGTMSAMFAALNPGLVKTLTLLASPIDFAGRESLLNVWADPAYFDVDALVDAHGNCPAWFLQFCFHNMKPIQNGFQKHLAMFDNIEDAQYLASYFAMESWVNDNIPVAGETFRNFVKDFYHHNRLVRGELQLGGKRIDLRQITCPLLVLTASNDHLVPPRSTEGIRPHVGSTDVETIRLEAGHVGLVVGGKAQRTLWPRATRWTADRSTSRTSALR
jgi:polyhydroxyalkanoate synthase